MDAALATTVDLAPGHSGPGADWVTVVGFDGRPFCVPVSPTAQVAMLDLWVRNAHDSPSIDVWRIPQTVWRHPAVMELLVGATRTLQRRVSTIETERLFALLAHAANQQAAERAANKVH